MSESPIIFLKAMDGKGGASTLNNLNEIQQCTQPVWLHLDANHPDAQTTLMLAVPNIDEHSLAAILHTEARPRVLTVENGVLIILRGINHNEGAEHEDMMAVRFWITEKIMVTLRYRRSKAVMQIANNLDKNIGPKNIGDAFSQINSLMLSFIEGTISDLAEKIDDLEADVLDKPDRALRIAIGDVRKSAILLRRYISPQRDAINQLRNSDAPWLTTKYIRRIQEAQDALTRHIEDLDSIRDRSQVVKDELMNSLSDKLNRNLYLLSVITAVFLPLGFLTGLFGINIGGMPGVDNSHAFMYFSCFLILMVGLQIVFFKVLKWF